MATRVASIFAEIGLDASSFDKGADTLGGAIGGIVDSISNMHPALAAAVSALSAYASLMNQAADIAVASAKEQARLEAVIKATGGAAGLTADEVSDLVDELSKMSGVDDDLIKSSASVLLTFREIGKETFPTAMQAALDMSAVMGQDLQSSVVQLGKALNDPLAGISALSRVGVTFNEEQKKQIKAFVEMNDLASAQGVILAELNNEFGGTAQAMADAGDGTEQLQNAWDNYLESIGQSTAETRRKINDLFTDILTDQTEANNARLEDQSNFQKAWDDLARSGAMSRDAYDITVEDQRTIQRYANELERGAQMTAYYADQVEDLPEKIDDTTLSLEEQTAALEHNSSLYDMIGSFQKEYDSNLEETQKLEEKRLELQQEFDAAWAQGYRNMSEGSKLGGIQEQLDEVNQAIEESATAHEEAARRIVFSYIEQQIAADGMTSGELNNLLALGQAWGIYSEEVVGAAQQALAGADQLVAGIETAAANGETLTFVAKAGVPDVQELNVYASDVRTVNQEMTDSVVQLDETQNAWVTNSGEMYNNYSAIVQDNVSIALTSINELIAAYQNIPTNITTTITVVQDGIR